jgi:NhaP-type Na+/H+ or K+/H+ antiporter
LSLGGIAIGCIFGLIGTLWIKKIYYDSILIVNITLVFSYIVYYTANTIEIWGQKFSGIISVVSFGN